MNAIHKRLALTVACIAVPMLLAVEPAAARATSCEVAQAGTLDARLAARADQGPEALRRFITRTRMIYGLDWSTALARGERFRRARAECVASGGTF